MYSIFLAIVVSLFAEGWERPSVSGTHPLSHRHSVPCVPSHPIYCHQHVPVAYGMHQAFWQVPLSLLSHRWHLPAAAASWEGHMHACVAPMVDFCILQGYDLASSGASLVTGSVTVPESLETAGLLAWGLFSGPWARAWSFSHRQLINTALLEVVQAWLGGFFWPFSTRRPL